MPLILNTASCHDLAVPMEVMQHVVNVESGSNPFAIGVVGARLERQPQNLDEAVATARMLESQGYNYSLGVAQVNRANFARYGLDSYEKAFDVCPNLQAGTQILAQCYAQAGGAWDKAFSCYYSGNFAKGFADGYVQKVVDSMNRTAIHDSGNSGAAPIPLVQANRLQPVTGADYLIHLRSETIDSTASSVIANVAEKMLPTTDAPTQSSPIAGTPPSALDIQAAAVAGTHLQPGAPADVHRPSALDIQAAAVAGAPIPSAQPSAQGGDIFEPQVRGPNDPLPAAAQENPAAQAQPSVDRADLRLGGHDDAFVF